MLVNAVYNLLLSRVLAELLMFSRNHSVGLIFVHVKTAMTVLFVAEALTAFSFCAAVVFGGTHFKFNRSFSSA